MPWTPYLGMRVEQDWELLRECVYERIPKSGEGGGRGPGAVQENRLAQVCQQ